ncbi:MAG TPA: peroxidase family protein, partial [Gemmatales bacterium]|nr:peroxidase family protein [Gemmatales bacterium]
MSTSHRRSSFPVRRQAHLRMELLEDRNPPAGNRPIDGVGNNLKNPTWGSTNTDFLRIAAAAYADSVSAPSGSSRPSARVVSNTIVAHPNEAVINNRFLSNMVYAWGQFIDHDIDLTDTASPKESFNIAVPTGDTSFDPAGTGTQVIPLSRSNYDTATGTSRANPRQQVNSITAYLDGSMVYGSDATTANSLRTFSGGQLKTSGDNLLPVDAAGNFVAGDVRVNENPELTSLQTLFMREHNRLAAQLALTNPSWTDEQLYQQARRLVIGEIQAITFNEFLPTLLGQNAVGAYRGYNPNVNVGITNEFATAAFRFGHSMLGDDIEFLDNNGVEIREAVELKDSFFNPALIKETNIDPLLKYLASDRAEEIDTKVVDSLRNFLFGEPGQGGLDLASLNVQRGRDHGLADYNTVRAAYGLPKVTSFAQITSDPVVQQQLQTLYGNVNNIDLWVGGLAEKHTAGGSLGQTFTTI